MHLSMFPPEGRGGGVGLPPGIRICLKIRGLAPSTNESQMFVKTPLDVP